MVFTEQDIGAASITATLPKLALMATSPAVVAVSKDVTTMRFAAVEEALPFVGCYPIAYVVLHGVTVRSLLYDVARQEPASRSDVRGALVEDVRLFIVVVVVVVVVFDILIINVVC
ncbi:hypothetical protein TorRG33x02_320000 [Trema orientale]|uniref:Transmembrane protein n=1 Tax=Trema orientale TaxID=63057 RepID=A0A2P5BIK6_TREOI|nr:hypothetical protein TorRG33x02_320000 [Trema orientale]